MPLINRQFLGRMNLDTQTHKMPEADYLDALNITRDAQGQGQDQVVSNIVGNESVLYSLPAGVNKVIGNHPDKLRNRHYYFVWNEDHLDSILYYDKNTDTIVKVLANLTDTNTLNVTNFDPSYKINHIDIIPDDLNGDLLFWTDGLNPPSQINVERAVAGDYVIVTRKDINVIKAPPSIQPYVVYEDDATVTVNNLRKKLFKAKYRYIYYDNEKSVWSAHSLIPLPYYYGNQDRDSDPMLNADIAMVLQTGTRGVRAIEIALCQNIGSNFGDFFLVDTLNKEELSIPDNDIYTYRFFNDKGYNYIDPVESVLGYDDVPQTAFTESLANGDVLVYANEKQGYDNLDSLGDTNITPANEYAPSSQRPVIMVVTQGGVPAYGSGVIHATILGTPHDGDNFYIYAGISDVIAYTATTGDTTTDVIAGLAASATGQGYTVNSSDDTDLYITKALTQLHLWFVVVNPLALSATDSTYAWDWWTAVSFGLTYFDDDGRLIAGVQTDAQLSCQFGGFDDTVNETQPRALLEIWNEPPPDASYYQITYTKNLTKSNILQWVSDRTFKDDIANPDNFTYAYISIETVNTFKKNNPDSPLGYSFKPNDRIRFIKLFPSGGLTTPQEYAAKDFEIVASVINPTINGVEHVGQFVKIILPTTGSDFDFGAQFHSPFTDIIYYYNYFIELYSPAQSVANGLNTYYEWSNSYKILNLEGVLVHQGMLQNQSADFVDPATFSLDVGDFYYRQRSVNVGVELTYEAQQGSSGDGIVTLGVDFSSATYDDTNVLTGNSPLQDLVGFDISTNDDRWLIKIVTGTYVFRFRGSIIVDFQGFSETYTWILEDNTGHRTDLVPPQLVTEGQHQFDFDVTFTLTSGQRIFILGQSLGNFANDKTYYATEMIATRELVFTLGMIDPNFSDYYPSAVNSAGRPWVIEPNAKQITDPIKFNFGGTFQSGTVINRINRFYPDDYILGNRSYGSVQKTYIQDNYMYVFQELKVGASAVELQIIKTAIGDDALTISNRLLNTIIYYKEDVGIGDCPESFACDKYAKYFVSDYKGTVNRLSQNGIDVISQIYDCNSFFVATTQNYRKTLFQFVPSTGYPSIYGAFDSYTNKYIIAMEEISNGELHYDPFTVIYWEADNPKQKGFECFASFHPENIGCLDTMLLSFVNGAFWKHTNPIFCNYYGVQYAAYVTGVFNDAPIEKKTWEAITENGNTIFPCTTIATNAMSYGTTPQASQLISQDFTLLEVGWSAAFLRDINSIGGIINGDTLKGNYIIIKFEIASASDFVFLSYVSVLYKTSYLTTH